MNGPKFITPIVPEFIVFQTRYNADMTEGRGPMLPGYTFTSRAVAEKYIDEQDGVMGRRAKWSQEKFGDWDILEVPVYQNYPTPEQELKARALAKLTPEERKVLGL